MSKSEARSTPASSLVIFLSRFSVFPSSDDEKSKTEFHFKIESAGAARPPAASALLQPRGATPVCAAPPSLRTLRAGNVEGLATQRASVYVRRCARLVRKSDICHLLPRDHTQRLEWRIMCTRAWGWHARGTHATARAWEYVRV